MSNSDASATVNGPLDAARSGDPEALQELLKALYDPVYRTCRRMMTTEADALDATQDAMVSIVRGLKAFDGRSSLSTWVYRVNTNTCSSALSKEARHRSHELPSGAMSTTTSQDTRAPQQSVASNVAAAHALRPGATLSLISPATDPIGDAAATNVDVDRALEHVPPQFRIALLLRSSEGMSYEEIGLVLGVPVGTVRSRIARARALLARELFSSGADAGADAGAGENDGTADAGAMEQDAAGERQTESR